MVALADLGATRGDARLAPGIERELSWMSHPNRRIRAIDGRVRRCASIEGNAVYSCTRLGFAGDPRVHRLVEELVEWQWPDGGWNCDVRPQAHRSSFHETVTPAIALAIYHQEIGDPDALTAARRSAELLLDHRLFRSVRDGTVIRPAWIKLHYPAYWHYDILQGLWLLNLLGLLSDSRAADALDVVRSARRPNGRFSGPAWRSAKMPDAVDWGHGTENEMLNLRAATILRAAQVLDVKAADFTMFQT